MRLDKYLAETAQCTRSEAKVLLSKGRVQVNGAVCKKGDTQLKESDTVVVDGKALNYQQFVYLMLNKPEGYVSATEDRRDGCPVVTELCEERDRARVFPCGRLDKYTVGLMLLTDDGELSHRLLSPARHVDKTYRYTSAKPLDDEAAVRLQNGVYIEGGYLTAPCLVKRESDFTGLITIHEGKYHQIKQMLGAVGNEITALERISFGPLALDPALGRGEVRYLTSVEVAALRTAAGLE